MRLLVVLKLIIAAALMGCSEAKYNHPGAEPTAEALERELSDKPLASDPEVKPPGPELTRNIKGRYIDFRAIKDLSSLGYEVLVVINKATRGPRAQSMQVYHHGQLFGDWDVSTGAEKWALDTKNNPTDQHTPLGHFRPIEGRLHEVYFSDMWQADMPHSIFFIGGVAIHGTDPLLYPLLGKNVSGGCIRLHRDNAKKLFDLVKNQAGRGTVAQINQDGRIQKDGNGQIIYGEGYRTLIIVHQSVID